MAQLSIGGLVLGKTPVIKSIQYGSVALADSSETTDTAAINAVDTDNSVVMHLGQTASLSGASNNYSCVLGHFILTNSTTVTFSRGWDNDVGLTGTFVVIEFAPGVVKSKQVGSIFMQGDVDTTGTATINAVVTNKAMLVNKGFLVGGGTNDSFSDVNETFGKLTLTDTTTVTASRAYQGNDSGDDSTGYFTVMEFF